MSKPEPPSDEAYARLVGRADALERATARPGDPGSGAGGGHAVDQAYKILALLLGGALVGLALGFGLDALSGGATKPWGLIGGLLAGFAVSIFLAKRTADQLMKQAAAESRGQPAPAAVVRDDDEED